VEVIGYRLGTDTHVIESELVGDDGAPAVGAEFDVTVYRFISLTKMELFTNWYQVAKMEAVPQHFFTDFKLYRGIENRPCVSERMELAVLAAGVYPRRQASQKSLIDDSADEAFIQYAAVDAGGDGFKSKLHKFTGELIRIPVPNWENGVQPYYGQPFLAVLPQVF
jgi:hypothetical protein